MNKMMNMFQSVVSNVKQQHEEQKKRDAADAAWVEAQPESKVIGEYFRVYFDKKEPGYRFLKENHQCMWVNVKEEGVELSWQASAGGAQSFREVSNAFKDAKMMVPFGKIYQWGGCSGFSRLDTKAKRRALERIIDQHIMALPHMKNNGSYTVKMFQ